MEVPLPEGDKKDKVIPTGPGLKQCQLNLMIPSLWWVYKLLENLQATHCLKDEVDKEPKMQYAKNNPVINPKWFLSGSMLNDMATQQITSHFSFLHIPPRLWILWIKSIAKLKWKLSFSTVFHKWMFKYQCIKEHHSLKIWNLNGVDLLTISSYFHLNYLMVILFWTAIAWGWKNIPNCWWHISMGVVLYTDIYTPMFSRVCWVEWGKHFGLTAERSAI